MCSINGFSWPDKQLLGKMNTSIAYRGPDDQGIFTDKNVSIGQRRLSIIDLSAGGHQPKFYTHKKQTVGIVFNGEIYNYQDIKKELEKKKYRFTSSSDTEVILASYIEWGTECVNKFNGMWAFCLYDKEKQLLFCSRDRAGKKPFYYYAGKEGFIFSSALKGILQHKKLKLANKKNINHQAVQLYFSLGFIPAPMTIFKGVSKLKARENLVYDLKKKKIAKQWEYYTLPAYTPVQDKQKLIAEGRALLKDAVRLRMIADVPVGAFLSGGLDSSTVVAEMAEFTDLKKLHTFSIGTEDKYDESRYMNIVQEAFGTKHHHIAFTKKDAKNVLTKHADMYDEPYSDYSGLPIYMLSAEAKKYVTVALSGDGGDEIFGGYSTHVAGHRMELIRKVPASMRKLAAKLPVKKNLNSMASLYLFVQACDLSLAKRSEFYAKALPGSTYAPTIYKEWTETHLAEALKKSDGSLGEALRIYDLLYHTVPDHFLVKVDRASMGASLEVRCPFLDYRLMEFSQRIPATWKADSFKTKKLMREIISGIVPESIIKRPKQGFLPSLADWTREHDLSEGIAILKELDTELYTFYKENVLAKENELHGHYKARLLLFQLWWKRWIL